MNNFCEVMIGSGETQTQPQQEYHIDPQQGNMCIQYGPDGPQVRDTGPSKMNTSDGQGPLNAKTPWGSPTSEIKDDTIVTIGGYQMRADIALRSGLLIKSPEGRYL